MTHFADLSVNSYHGLAGNVRAIGWLEFGQDFPKGKTPRKFRERLLWLLSYRVADLCCLGMHYCDLCEAQGRAGPDCRSSQWGIFVPSETCVYEAPSWIGHYILSHGYLPPQGFQDAVLSCPSPDSMAYIELIRTHARLPHTGEVPICRINPNRTLFRSIRYGRGSNRHEPVLFDPILFRSISEIGISATTAEILRASDILNVGDLLRASKDGLMQLPQIGYHEINEIENALEVNCLLSFDQKLDDWPPLNR